MLVAPAHGRLGNHVVAVRMHDFRLDAAGADVALSSSLERHTERIFRLKNTRRREDCVEKAVQVCLSLLV